jgi:ABC-2 type transport system permease protein
MFQRLRQMLIKEFIQVIRDPRMRAVIFVIPSIQVLVIGYAVTMDVRHVPTAIYDLDNTVASRELTDRFIQSHCFDVVAYARNDREMQRLIDHSRAMMVLHFQKGFSEDLRAGRTARVQVIVDGTDSNTAAVVMSYANRITSQYSNQVQTERYARKLGAAREPGRVDLRTRAWFNANLESRNYFVPGVIVIVLTLVTLLLTSMAVVREKEIGTMEQIMVTPITPTEFILGKTIPFALIGYIDVFLVTLIGVFWFDVPIRGSLLLLFLSATFYLMTTLGMGLLISTISATQQQAMMSVFFFFFPAMLLSGFAFPIANMPQVIQWLTLLNPMRYFLVIIRSIFLKGVGLEVLWPQVLALAVMGMVVLFLATRRFHKTLA